MTALNTSLVVAKLQGKVSACQSAILPSLVIVGLTEVEIKPLIIVAWFAEVGIKPLMFVTWSSCDDNHLQGKVCAR